ncbi:MAG: hypothetical protein PF495_13360 [Spirochaetales bacterium]|jgi:hypothetical protein|nr:hypothetical protein [Spirochaetales bacterium]
MDRFWGEDKDKIAAKQLGVGDEYSIFMMANEMEYYDDIDKTLREVADDGDWNLDHVHEAIENATKRVMLPGRLQLVGMSPIDDETKEVYGVVDFSLEETDEIKQIGHCLPA